MIVFLTILLSVLLVLGGTAVDLAYVAAAKGELQRSMDAAALAGAGKLGFDKTAFGTAREWSSRYAGANRFHAAAGGGIDLGLNPDNAVDGGIVLGRWSSGSFTRWDPTGQADPNGTLVNAVRCRTSAPVATSFLRLLGLPTLTVGAMATAIANPPATVGCDEPTLPIAVTKCGFYDAGTGAFTSSNGCGTGLTFIRSQTLCNNSPGSSQACNTATWASLDGATPNTPYLITAINRAANPGGSCGTMLRTNDLADVNNGMLDAVFTHLATTFRAKRVVPLAEDVCPVGGCGDGTPPTYAKANGGWDAVVLLIDIACPPAAMSGEYRVLTYSRFVVTQVFDKQDGCAIMPNPDPQAAAYCQNPDGTARKDPDLRAVFGYFRCARLGEYATTDPVPRAALAPRLKLVE